MDGFLDTFSNPTTPAENYPHAVQFLQSPRTMDWVAQSMEFGDNEIFSNHFLGYVCLIGKPYKGISVKRQGIFYSMNFTLGNWQNRYSSEAATTFPFSLRGRAIELATFIGQYKFPIVFHPHDPDVLPEGNAQNLFLKQGIENSMLSLEHAETLASYIVPVFTTKDPDLASRGFTADWRLGDRTVHTLRYDAFAEFLTILFRDWEEELQGQGCDEFWLKHSPYCHLYDYGANIRLSISEEGFDFPREVGGQLGALFDLDNLKSFSCAVATQLTYDADGGGEDASPVSLSILADRELLEGCYRSRADKKKLSFYPLALSPRAGNFQSPRAPDFFREGVLDIVQEYLARDNAGREIMSVGYFHGYNLTAHAFQHTPTEFELNNGHLTAALCTPKRLSEPHLRKRARSIQKICRTRLNEGKRPLGREMQQIITACESGLVGFRMEVILNFEVIALKQQNKTSRTF